MKYLVDTIIFDFDGVLVDTGPDVANAVNFTLLTLGLDVLPQAKIISYIGGGAEVLIRRCLAEHADNLIDQALPMFIKRYKDHCCVESRLYDGAEKVLGYYQQAGKCIAIATQKNEPITQAIMQGLGIMEYVDILVCPEVITHRKPHPESILRILEQSGTDPLRAVVVGDTASDIQAGKAAGTLTCGVRYGYGSVDEIDLAKPDLVFDHLIQMLGWIG